MKTPREASKCREWEKVRRDKLNKSFTTLSKLLPNHDPSLTLSKIEILQKATTFIEELQKKLKDVLTGDGTKKAERDEIKALYERIRKLLLRNEQLSNLLKDAGIRIPSEYGSIKNFKEPLRWSNKITAEQAKQFAEKEAQKENKKETNKIVKKPKLKNGLKKTAIVAAKHQKKDIKHSTHKIKSNRKKSAVISVQLSNIMPIATQQNLTKVSSQPCFIIASNPHISLPRSCKTNKSASTVVTNSSSLAAPKMASIITPPSSAVIPKVNSTLSSLGPGTLILANGNIVPILPQPTTVLSTPTILTNPTSILLKPPSNNATLIVMPTKTSKEASITTSITTTTTTTNIIVSSCSTNTPTKTFTRIRPKVGITRTTQVNKVPIPALTSRYSNFSSSHTKSISNAPSGDKLNQKKVNNIEKKFKKRKLLKSSNNSKNKRTKSDRTACSSGSQSEHNVPVSNETNGDSEVDNFETKSDNKIADDALESVSIPENCNADVRLPLQNLENDKIDQPVVEPLEKSTDLENIEGNLNICNKGTEDSCRTITGENKIGNIKDSPNIKKDDKDITDNLSKANTTELITEDELSIKVSLPKHIEPPLITGDLHSPPSNKIVEKSSETLESKQNENKTSDNNCPPKSTNDKETIENNAIKMNKVSPTTTEVTVSKTTISVTQSNDTLMQDKNLELGMNLNHSELSNDIFSSLQVPIGGQNPESTSPTAAFLLAFPLVSSLTGVKVTEVIEEENSDSRHGTPTLLQIGTMDTTKTTQSVHAESLTPNLLNLDNFSFFSGKDMCSNFYSSFDNSTCSTTNVYPVTSVCNPHLQVLENQKNPSFVKDVLNHSKPSKIISEPQVQPKHQKENVSLGATTSNSHVLASNSSIALFTSEAQSTTKSNPVTQNTFVRQNTSASYSKLTPISTSYVHGSSIANSHMHYDGRQKISSTTSASPVKDMNVISYSTSSTRKNSDVVQCSSHYNTTTSNVVSVAQCNTYNPFSDFSKSSTVHSYSTFSKPYSDPLYTNSTHYNYSQPNGNNFEQSMYYSSKSIPSKSSNITYGTPSYPDPSYSMDCKSKRDSTNQRHNPINYYNQTKTPKEKFSSHSSKGVVKPPSNQPKPPINWMTTPDFRSQPTNSEYLVPPPFGKDIEYNPNSFYSSNSFAVTTHSSYFNTSSTMYPTPEFQNPVADNRKSFDSSLPIISSSSAQRNEFEENQFSWSPTKLPQFLETPHSFVSSTLPTLVGDLALGTTQPTFTEQKVDQGAAREHLVKSKDSNRRSKVHPVNYDNQSNFLSVSQLVENKTDLNSSSRATNRRNSGNRNVKNNVSHKGNKHSHKPTETKELVDGANQPFDSKVDTTIEKNIGVKQSHQNLNYSMQSVNVNSNWMADCNKSNRHGHKNSQSSYSAEALIGHQDQSDSSVPKQRYRQQQANYSAVNKAIPIPTFLSDNIVPYFPPVEIPQDNFIQTNPNYQSSSLAHSFPTSVQNNAYTSGTYISTGATITSSYLQNSGLIPEFGTHDYSAAITDNTAVVSEKVVENKHCNRNEGIKQTSNNNSSRAEERSNLSHQINTDCSANSSNNFMKKSKHKHANENNLPGIVDFGFLAMPNTINSPILPDDFHAHSNFLPPPTPSQLYPCKNPLYPKQAHDLNSGSLLSLPPVPVSRSGPQHFEGSAAASNVSSSLTSFNLSAIFPEINKGTVPLPGLYSEPSRNKGYNFQRNYLGSSVQVSVSNKSTSSNYVNSVATSYAPSN